MARLKNAYRLLVVGLVLVFRGSACAEVCKGSKAPKADLAQFNAVIHTPRSYALVAIEEGRSCSWASV